jgi:hypothetical protein
LGQRGRQTALERFDAALAKKGWVGLAAELLAPASGSLEPSASSTLPPQVDSPTLSIEPTHHGLPARELSDTSPSPGAPPENATLVTSERPNRPDWHRPHVPGDETPTPLKSF